MNRIAALIAFSCLLFCLPAQQTLQQLELRFRTEAQQLEASSPNRAQRDQLLDRHVGELRSFVQKNAQGDDRWNGRLWLADLELVRGKRDAATKVLAEIDADQAPAMILITAATMAQGLQLIQLRDQWIAKATEKKAPLIDRMAMGRLLMTVLREIPKGEAMFTEALATAKTDEDRAFVRWHRADALRDREDLPENTGFEELQKLANELPDTYWGSVAKDRLRATRLRIGDDAIPISGKTLDGKLFSTGAMRGKSLVLVFYTAADYDMPRLISLLATLQSKNDDLAVIGISLDRDPSEIRKAKKALGITFPVIGDGKGPQTDAALRWFVEGPIVHVIDKRGKIAGLGLQAGTNDGRTELTDIIHRTLR